MNPPTSFFGKCFTILVGAGLSWATLTNPNCEQLAARLCGSKANCAQISQADPLDQTETFARSADVKIVVGPTAEPDNRPMSLTSLKETPRATTVTETLAAVNFPQTKAGVTPKSDDKSALLPVSGEARIRVISAQLKQLGASYLVLEKLPQEQGVQYRARCDLARPDKALKCCFEATRETPRAAMEDVLRAVQVSSSTAEFDQETEQAI